MLLFPLSAILWNYLFESWGYKSKNFISKVTFYLIYISSPIWALQFAYRNQIEVLSIIAVILPISIYYLTKYINIICNKKQIIVVLYLILSISAIVFCFAGYQSFMIMYVLSIAIYFFINVIQNKIMPKDFYKKLLIFIIISIVMLILYYFSVYIFNVLSGTKVASSYIATQCLWLEKSFSKCMESLLKSLSIIFLGDNIVYTCILVVEFFVGIPILINKVRKIDNIGLKIWSVLIYFSMFLVALTLTIITAGQTPQRQQFSYVLLVAFLASFEIEYYLENVQLLKKVGILYGIICLIITYVVLIQFEMNTRLLYSDYFTMKNDYLEMQEIYSRAREKGAKPGDAIAFIGRHENVQIESTREYEVIGHSYFEVTNLDSRKLIEAMIGYGFDISMPNSEQMQYAFDRSNDMDVYPTEGSIVVENGLIVVNLWEK